jgi:outer membrane protein assembly factor BamB
MAGRLLSSARSILPVTLAATLSAGIASAADWPAWRGPSRNGVTVDEVRLTRWPASGPPRLWTANLGKSYASVTVQGERLYAIGTGGGQETVFCFDALSGRALWRSARPHPKRDLQYDPNPTASTGTPVAAGDRVYVLTREGLALCLNAADGKLCWGRELARETENGLPPFGCASSPVVEGSPVLYNVGKHGIALDRETGAILWNSGAGVAGHASPVVYRADDRPAAAFFTGEGLVGVDLRTGQRLWRHPWTTPNNINAVDPVISGDRIFITGYARGRQLRLAGDGVAELYETRSLRSTFNNPVLVGDYLYGSDRGTLACIEWATGVEKWRRASVLQEAPSENAGQARNPMSEGALIATGKHLIALSDTGDLRLIAAAPDAYRELARARVIQGPCWTAPVLANGVLYCRSNDGDLVALDLRRSE